MSALRTGLAPLLGAALVACAAPAAEQDGAQSTRPSSAGASARAVPARFVEVHIRREEVSVDGERVDRIAEALEKAKTENRLELIGSGPQTTLTVLVDPDVPYRHLFEVLDTAERGGISRYLLREVGTERVVVAQPKGLVARPPDPANVLDLTMLVLPSKVTLKTPTGKVAPGCSVIGKAADGSNVDLAALNGCAIRIKDDNPQADADYGVVVMAAPEMPFGEVVSAIKAIRANGERALFPNVAFDASK